ncbi:MAG: ribonuclease III [Erysipelotrichaceae bacterium]
MEIEKLFDKYQINQEVTNLVKRAFYHSSYIHEHHKKQSNERLEFVGDAVLQLYSADKLYNIYQIDEGEMTKLRSLLVCERTLAIYSKEIGLDKLLLLGAGEEKTGGRQRDSILGDLFEAFLGSLYLSYGFECANKFLDQTILKYFYNQEDLKTIDYKTSLQEYVQADIRKPLYYHLIKTSGPSNDPTFEIEVLLDDIVLGKGIGKTKKKAEQEAAKNALNILVK